MKELQFRYKKTSLYSLEVLLKEMKHYDLLKCITSIKQERDDRYNALSIPFQKNYTQKIKELVAQKKNSQLIFLLWLGLVDQA